MTDAISSPNLIAAAQIAKQSKAEQARTLIEKQANGQPMNSDEARKVAQEFESVFLGVMIAPMFEGESMKNSLTDSHAEQTYRGLLTEQYAETIAQTGGIGVADYIYRELMALQEVQQ